MKWNPEISSKNAIFSKNYKQVEINDLQYNFHTIHTDQFFTEGIHVFQLKILPNSKTDIKVGVSKKTMFNLKTAFCDHKFGWGLNCIDGTIWNNDQIS